MNVSTEADIALPSPSFFVPGGTLSQEAPSYVEREADQRLYANLREGRYCSVLSTRQVGKSSLMIRVANRLRAEGATVAVLELTAAGQNLAVDQWYFGLLLKLADILKLEDQL